VRFCFNEEGSFQPNDREEMKEKWISEKGWYYEMTREMQTFKNVVNLNQKPEGWTIMMTT
jgi:hypothetical protein